MCMIFVIQNSFALYGEDSRIEYYQIKNPVIKRQALAVAYQVERHYELRGWTFNRLWELVTNPYASQKICPEEKYVKQPALHKNCAGILVSPKHILTAGNCITEHYCWNDLYYWMFDYNLKSANEFDPKRPKKNFYKCKEVIERYYDSENEVSYTLLELKKEVKHIRPAELNLTDEIKVGDSLTIVGHMRGLPLKIDTGAKVIEKYLDNKNLITNSDLPGQYSLGSVALNSHTGKVEGFLVGGTAGYVQTSEGCLKERSYGENEGYEYLFNIQNIKDLLDRHIKY